MNACSVSDCERVPVKKHGICKMHLKRITRTGRTFEEIGWDFGATVTDAY